MRKNERKDSKCTKKTFEENRFDQKIFFFEKGENTHLDWGISEKQG